MITPPEWLTEPVALKIWDEYKKRLEAKRLLETTDPNMLGAFCYCLEKAINFTNIDPKTISWIGAMAPADRSYKEPRWVGYPHRPGENPLVYLWRRGAAYASNRLGLWPQKHISYFELGLYDNWNELDPEDYLVYKHGGEVIFRLDRAWQVGED
jgi:hypothetical protein